jgi:hypothetical protein
MNAAPAEIAVMTDRLADDIHLKQSNLSTLLNFSKTEAKIVELIMS